MAEEKKEGAVNASGGGGGGDDGGGSDGGSSARVSTVFRDVAAVASQLRQRFTIELNPDETTIVSWKKLVRESANNASKPPIAAEPPAGAHPALQSRIAPPGQPAEGEGADVPQTNRFTAVIEKIERLYVGNESSEEEELANVPDDDQYDTEDSFIDDASLDEYFQVDESTTKHKGFFVNRGKLESLTEHSSSPKQQPKKRRRKDLTIHSEKANDSHPNKQAKMGNMRMKDAARTVPMERKTSSPSRSLAQISEQYQDAKSFSKSNTFIGPSEKRSSDSGIKLDQCMATEIPRDQLEAKDAEKQRTGAIQSRDLGSKLKVSDTTHQIYQNKDSSQTDPQTRSCNETKVLESKVRQQEKNSSSESPSRNFSKVKNNGQTTRSPTHLKDGFVRPKGTALERAIRDLEDIVKESRPPNGETQDANNSLQGVKRRLPREVKQKLAKVARLAQSSQGKVSDELINRLMGIVGHIIQRKSLKRNLREMVVLGLSAKQEKDVKFQQIKKELVEMIRMRSPYLKPQVLGQQDVASDDFQEVRRSEEGVLKVKSSIDNAMEDKLCDLYDLYVEGMDEDKSSQVRKLYVELAELWPTGTMDNHGIKRAVCRSKARKRAIHSRIKSQEKMKQQKPSLVRRLEDAVCGEANPLDQPRPVQERTATDSSNRVLASPNRVVTNVTVVNQQIAASGKMFHLSTNGFNPSRPIQEKIKGIPGSILSNTKKTIDHNLFKKKLKRKAESTVHYPSGKLALEKRKEKNKLPKQDSSHPNKPDFQFAGFPRL